MRKITLTIISVLILFCTVSLIYEKINKRKVENSNEMFAIFLEEEKDTGRYQKSNLKTWPTEAEYIINMKKSYCENGSILRWNNETKKLSLKVKGTDKCYVYFDKAEIGSEKHPHLIQTIEDLVRLSNDVNGGKTYAGEYFLLTNDLDFNDASDYEDASRLEFKDINGINGDEALIKELTTGSGFVPIGKDATNSFQGTFDGGNHAIDNLYIERESKGIGLFGTVKNTQISNLKITGKINKVSEGAGLASYTYGNTVINNVHNYVQVTGTQVNGIIGGLIAVANDNLMIKNSENKVTITNNNGKYIGGLIGLTKNTTEISNSKNDGDIINNNGLFAGGLIGADYNASTITIINKSQNTGNITSQNLEKNSNNYNGGIIGFLYGKFDATETYNAGDIKAQNVDTDESAFHMSGGIIGQFESGLGYVILKKCHNSGNLYNGNGIGGLLGCSWGRASAIIDKSYNSGNIEISDSQKHAYVGGLISRTIGGDIKIINSYNEGNINIDAVSAYAGGISGINYYSANLKVINSYNVGNMNYSGWYLNGLIFIDNGKDYSTQADTHFVGNNLYNFGKINAGEYHYGIGQIYRIDAADLNNIYNYDYNKASNLDIGINKTEEEIKSQKFVEELNSNILGDNILKINDGQMSLEEIDESLKDYKLSKWQLGSNGYPELINE